VQAGSVIGPGWDSLFAKLIVTGASRRQALERARRALAELAVPGLATVLPFHRAIAGDPAFTSEPVRVHTRWIETEFASAIPPHDGDGNEAAAEVGWQKVVVEVGSRRLDISLPAGPAPPG
jgi:acetyl-CoA/propionyl-CoA/long-chain acyl-CoA carboxylase, biotin carboxylase, biotin carboxyl carrier protein